MAKAKKLPSGNWRVRVYSHTDSNGKKHYESFTASTKQQAEMMGAKFANDIERQRENDLTISEAVSAYIKSNDGVLSPSTIHGYVKDSKKIASIGHIRVRKVTTQILQQFITDLLKQGLSPKSVRNVWGLLRPSLTFAGCDRIFKIHLPPKEKKPWKSPENDEISLLYNHASPTLKKAIFLGCLSLRRSEICAIKYGDITGNKLYVHASMVWGADKKWHYKPTPKTGASNRVVYLPATLLDMLGDGGDDDYVIAVNPNAIGNAFLRLKKKYSIDIRFHDLRHYFASLAKLMNIPDTYAENLGGWERGSKTLRAIYQNEFDGKAEEYADMIGRHIESMTQNTTQK